MTGLLILVMILWAGCMICIGLTLIHNREIKFILNAILKIQDKHAQDIQELAQEIVKMKSESDDRK